MIHRRSTKHIVGYTPVSERIVGYVDVRMLGAKFRLVSVYFLDSSYAGAEVPEVYEQHAEMLKTRRKRINAL